jgi:pyruvate dehydrogenase E2 component (dihydrolipoamide acetyltransferase)
MNYEFKLPDIGEGLTEGEVVKWHVQEGQSVKENEPLCNVLTDKAEVEIPSPKTGKIAKLMAKPGEKVQVHAPLVIFELEGNVSGGVQTHSVATSASAAVKTSVAVADKPSEAMVSATPAVRKLAKDLGVDIAAVKGTGPGGRVTEVDVRGFAGGASKSALAPSASSDIKIPFTGIRRKIADKMSESWKKIPHVAHMEEADLTALVQLREDMKKEAEQRTIKLTYLPFIIKALVKTFPEFPMFNATLNEAESVIIEKRSYNIGIAVSADQGLVVPVIKGAGNMDVWGLAAEIERLAEKARANRLELSEMQGGTFTITNIGPLGGLFATPIINFPEVAILGVMKIQDRPMVREGKIEIRKMANFILSFDHRITDGAQAAMFMNTFVKHLENPRTLI